jgi:cytochrome oxidase assembly protein ShyY1
MTRPRWIALSIALVVFVVSCVELGLWQLRRNDSRRHKNALATANMALPETPMETIAAPVDRLPYRHVSARGHYDTANEILLSGRALNDRPGWDVLTPLVTADGRALIVNRGFVPLSVDKPGAAQAMPPTGTVTVEGILLASEGRGLFGQSVPETGRLETIPRIDVSRIGKQLPYAVFPVYLLLAKQSPPQPGTLPAAEPFVPDLEKGPHLGYAIQWFSFAFAAIAVYGVGLRRGLRTSRPMQPS